MDLHKPNNKLVSAQLKHLWCTDEPQANTDSQDSPRSGLGGIHHLFPYNIICAWPQGLHPNVILSWHSQVGSHEIFEIRTFVILEAHNFFLKLLIKMRSKAKLQPLSRAFQRYVACHLHASKSGRFLTFSGRESNYHLSWFCSNTCIY